MKPRSLVFFFAVAMVALSANVIGCSDEALPGLEKEHGEDDYGDIPGSNRGQSGSGTGAQDGSTSTGTNEDAASDSGADSAPADSGVDSGTDSGIDDSGTDGS